MENPSEVLLPVKSAGKQAMSSVLAYSEGSIQSQGVLNMKLSVGGTMISRMMLFGNFGDAELAL